MSTELNRPYVTLKSRHHLAHDHWNAPESLWARFISAAVGFVACASIIKGLTTLGYWNLVISGLAAGVSAVWLPKSLAYLRGWWRYPWLLVNERLTALESLQPSPPTGTALSFPGLPQLFVSKVIGGSRGMLFETLGPGDIGWGLVPGSLFVELSLIVDAAMSNCECLTARAIKAGFDFEGMAKLDGETGQYTWRLYAFDSRDTFDGPYEFQPGAKIRLTCTFVLAAGKANEDEVTAGHAFHLPKWAMVKNVVIEDTQNRSYALSEDFKIPMARWEERAPWPAG